MEDQRPLAVEARSLTPFGDDPGVEGAPSDDSQRTRAALRASEEKYRLLFESMAEGFSVVELRRDVDGRAVDMRYLELNPALERHTGIPRDRLLGQWMSEVFLPGDTAGTVTLLGEVVDSGEPMTFEQHIGLLDRWYEVSAYPRGGDRLSLFYRDVTERKRNESTLREREAEHAFLLELADALRPLSDPAAIRSAACRMLGRHLDVDRAYYVEIDDRAGVSRVEDSYLAHDIPSLVGRHRVDDFGWVVAPMRRGETLVIDDVSRSPLIPEPDRPMMDAVRIAAHVNVPLVKDGTLVGALCVTQCEPRTWTDTDVILVGATAERIWGALERAQSIEAQRISEDRYRTLFERIDEGFCILVVDFDDDGGASDYRFLEVNPAFEAQTGLRDVCGRSMRELAPDHEQFWFDTYGRIARTGVASRFRHDAGALGGRWYDVYAFRIGAPDQHHVAVIFDDVSDELRALEALQDSEERFRRFAEASSDVLSIRDADTLVSEYLSPAVEVIAGQDAAAVGGDVERWLALIVPEDRDMVRSCVRAACAGERRTYDYRIRRPDGEIRWVRNTHFPMCDGEGRVQRLGGITQDITEQKQIEAALRQLNESLEERVNERTREVNDLTLRLTMAEQEERRRISAVLHDDLQQVLYGVEAKISGALAAEPFAGSSFEARRDLDVAKRWIEAAIATTRRLTVDLSPPILRGEGLTHALHWLRRQMLEIHGLQVTVEGHDVVTLSDDVRVLLFQTVRELLFNVTKHARTDRARVTVAGERDDLVIRVIDEGRGFDPSSEESGTSRGIGLVTARERLHLLGGSLVIDSSPGRGAAVEIRVPFDACREER